MEYIGICPVCHHHTIVKTIKQIHYKGLKARLPQKLIKCDHCDNISRITIIGTVEKPNSATNEFDPECGTTNTLRMRLWK